MWNKAENIRKKRKEKWKKMEFRPCIDIHNGRVKQIVGGSLQDEGNRAKENFVAGQDAACFADIYRNAGIRGGHVILLNPEGSSYYPATKEQALKALRAYPGGTAGRRRDPPGEWGGVSGSGSLSCDCYILCIPRRQDSL